jgi:septum formation protein
MEKIILATTSSYRQEAFRFLGLDFISEGSQIEEHSSERPPDPASLVQYLAKLKAEAVAKSHSSGIVIGFDSVGWFQGRILEKPKSKEEGFVRLKALSGQDHQFYTGVYLINTAKQRTASQVVKTQISMRGLSDSEIEKYLEQDPNFNTYALGYDPLGHYSSTFARQIGGSYNNFLRGIPLEIIPEMLSLVGY